MAKSTDELNDELKEANDIRQFMKDNEEELLSEKLSDILNGILKKKGLTKAQVINNADISKSYSYELLNEAKNKAFRIFEAYMTVSVVSKHRTNLAMLIVSNIII